MRATPSPFPGRRASWLGLAVAVLLPLAAAAVPIYLIRPFVLQTPRGVAIAYWVQRSAPALTAVALVAGLALAVSLGRRARWWTRVGLGLLLLPLGAAAFVARFNLYEKMFAPLPAPAFVAAADAGFVAPGDMVLAVEAGPPGSPAAAFPVRQLSYHHVVNTEVGGKAVVATY
jgi:hypothetical protein